MQFVEQDYYGHVTPSSLGVSPAYTAATSGTAAGTVVAGAVSNGTAPTSLVCNDQAGTFSIVGEATATAGILATVYFAQPYPFVPKSVIPQVYDSTGSVALLAVASAPALGLQSGFNVVIAAPGAGSHTLLVTYIVQP
jgi:hypothetical protein